MEFNLETSVLSRVSADAIVLGIFQDEDPAKEIRKIDKSFPEGFIKDISRSCSDEGFEGNVGQVLRLPTYGALKAKKLILSGMGKRQQSGPRAVSKLAANTSRLLNSQGNHKSVCLFLRTQEDRVSYMRAAIEGWILGSYKFSKYKSQGNGANASNITVVTVGGIKASDSEFRQALKIGSAVAEATNLARDLINEPAAYMTPTRLAQVAKGIAKEHGLTCEILGLSEVEKLKMGSFIGVAKGAKEPPKFIVMQYRSHKAKKTIALVGKGITFDSGGLSLKTAQGMEHMKYDMSGAAAVIATMKAIGTMKLPVAVLALAAVTENMPGGSALHPGDVLTAMNGKTIEVNNTDAEGRLILADALCYAIKQDPDEVIDIATLTGACVTALGRIAAGVMGNDQKLVEKVIESGNKAGERLWQLPMFEEYKETLKSDVADLKNSGSKGEAGTSSAALFLAEFIDGKPWVHLDIAGPGWMEKERDEYAKGGTGFGVRTLCQYLISQA